MTDWRKRFTVVPAVYLVMRKDGRILMMRRANTGYMDGYYGLPAGHLDGGEAATIAAAREAKEEVGVVIRPEDLRLVHTVHRRAEEGDHERIDLFFAVDSWEGEPHNAEPEKCDEVTWMLESSLPEKTIPLVRDVLVSSAKGEIYSEYFSEPAR